jgi:HrpA-like RNA helicase
LTGQDEIETACTQLREYCKTKDDNSTSFQLMILPLYASLSPTDQKKAFTQVNIQTCRKCVFATNIAETSVTVSGIK